MSSIIKHLPIIFTLLLSSLLAEPADRATSLDRLTELGNRSQTITKETTEEEVIALLGEPLSKGTGGWNRLQKKVWHYLSYTDDSIHRSFSVSFDPDEGCAVSHSEILRKDREKLPLLVSTGIVMDAPLPYPDRHDKGFLCTVQLNDSNRNIIVGLGVADLNRVKGTPAPGATVRLEFRSITGQYIFTGARSLDLESIIFTAKSTPIPDAPPTK